jgi:hypothetical protein
MFIKLIIGVIIIIINVNMEQSSFSAKVAVVLPKLDVPVQETG